ncbi:MAG: type II toxin-antitoxin system death-on-curing family toxin [Ferruginibacter sp.]
MIDISDVLSIHKILIEKFGGAEGVRDYSALSSAIQRPFQTFDNINVYTSIVEKASALIESILINHPFIDGNKRTGYVLLRRYLIQNNLDISATEQEKYEFVISIASGEYKFSEIVLWLSNHTVKINGL